MEQKDTAAAKFNAFFTSTNYALAELRTEQMR